MIQGITINICHEDGASNSYSLALRAQQNGTKSFLKEHFNFDALHLHFHEIFMKLLLQCRCSRHYDRKSIFNQCKAAWSSMAIQDLRELCDWQSIYIQTIFFLLAPLNLLRLSLELLTGRILNNNVIFSPPQNATKLCLPSSSIFQNIPKKTARPPETFSPHCELSTETKMVGHMVGGSNPLHNDHLI